jgi:hypothetical protein
MKVTRRIGRLSGFIAMGVAIAGTGWGVMTASYSTFSAQTANPTNSWTSGTLTLNDDDANGAMFAATPTATQGVKCIKVNSTGSYQGTVKLYSTGLVNADGLAEHINMKIEVGGSLGVGAFGGCSSFAASGSPVFDGKLKAFDTASNSYLTGAATGWVTPTSAADYRVFRFTWSYDDGAPQNATASDTFTWEAQTS